MRGLQPTHLDNEKSMLLRVLWACQQLEHVRVARLQWKLDEDQLQSYKMLQARLAMCKVDPSGVFRIHRDYYILYIVCKVLKFYILCIMCKVDSSCVFRTH